MQLKKYREQAGMTQAELGDKICVTQQTIANYENGHRTPSVRVCMDIIKALKKSGVDITIEGLFR